MPAEVDEAILRLVEIVRPKLVHDGMFLVGLDVVDDKLMEINVFSPGGLGSSVKRSGVDFTAVEALLRKVPVQGALRAAARKRRDRDTVRSLTSAVPKVPWSVRSSCCRSELICPVHSVSCGRTISRTMRLTSSRRAD